MVIKWSEFAKKNLRDFVKYSTLLSPTSYVRELVSIISILQNQPKSGKILFCKDDIETRQIIYKMHKIIYRIKDNEIHIGAVLHIKYNLDNSIKFINKFFN